MDLKLFLMTFGAVFIAELGDKTQLATMNFAAGNKHALWIVFFASALALVTTSAIGVLAGNVLANYIDPKHITTGAGVLFIIIGVWTLWGSSEKKELAFERLRTEIERYAALDHCRSCQNFQAALREIADKGHAELKDPIAKATLAESQLHAPKGCPDCSAAKLLSAYAEDSSARDKAARKEAQPSQTPPAQKS